jgi:hypothetical protein
MIIATGRKDAILPQCASIFVVGVKEADSGKACSRRK